MNKKCTAVLLAAGSGRRMNSATAKQFMILNDKPLIYYALKAIEDSKVIDDCVLVTGEADISYVQREIVDLYAFKKVRAIVAGGSERWESVAFALKALKEGCLGAERNTDYIFIHDGARPFLSETILENTFADVQKYHACVAAVPSKDTVKISDAEGFAVTTPDRKTVWQIQTPQVFDAELIIDAYAKLQKKAEEIGKGNVGVTDDASVVEMFTECPVKLTESSYTNIKITTPEDLLIAESFLK